jgi:hypothetical protein
LSPRTGTWRLSGALGVSIDEAGIAEIYEALCSIIGQWWNENARLDSAAVAQALISISQKLDKIRTTLNAHSTGPRNTLDIEIVSQLAGYIALDPNVGSITAAKDLIASFIQDATTIAHSGMVAGSDLRTRSGTHGRTRLEWYDDFTALLLKIANKAGMEPSLNKDRITGERRGWLFEAALALETFFYPKMRSPTDEACGKRLERGKQRLAGRQKQ